MASKNDGGVMVVAFLFVMVAAAALSLLFCFPIKWLWNWLMPSIFGLPAINIWKAWGLAWLCSMLFGVRSGSSTTSKSDA